MSSELQSFNNSNTIVEGFLFLFGQIGTKRKEMLHENEQTIEKYFQFVFRSGTLENFFNIVRRACQKQVLEKRFQ